KQLWIQINGENIRIDKKKIKNMYLRISPSDGEIQVSAPVNMPLKEIEIFVREKWSWILEARKRLEKARKNTDGEQLSEEEEKLQKEAYRKQLMEILPEVIRKCEQTTGLHAKE